MVRSLLLLTLLLSLSVALAGVLTTQRGGTESVSFEQKRRLVAELGLTDLSLCSEARYTRHPSQADLFSAFQDFPAAFEHFPTGSLIIPEPLGFSGRVQILPQAAGS